MSIYVKVWKQPSEQASQCIPHATNIWKTCFVPVPTVSHSRVYNICATCRPWRRARSYGTSARQASQNKANHGKLLEGPGLPRHANSKRSTFEFLPHNSFRNFLWCNFGYAHPGEFDHHMLYIFELNPSRHLSTASPSRLREWWSSQSHGAWGHIKICWFHHFIWYQSSDQDLFGLTFLSTKSCQSLPSSSENQRDTAPVATFSTINFYISQWLQITTDGRAIRCINCINCWSPWRLRQRC